jgi:hypothetical protein
MLGPFSAIIGNMSIAGRDVRKLAPCSIQVRVHMIVSSVSGM